MVFYDWCFQYRELPNQEKDKPVSKLQKRTFRKCFPFPNSFFVWSVAKWLISMCQNSLSIKLEQLLVCFFFFPRMQETYGIYEMKILFLYVLLMQFHKIDVNFWKPNISSKLTTWDKNLFLWDTSKFIPDRKSVV